MRRLFVYWLTTAVVLAELPTEWKQAQTFDVAQPGLIKLSLPADTLNASRPGLEDLRIFDPTGREVPYVIERPVASPALQRSPKEFQVKIDEPKTVIDIETGVAQPMDAITLETPAPSFVKAVFVAGSTDRENWQSLAVWRPIFRQPTGESQLRVAITQGVWPLLRVTVDDYWSAAIPFTGARLEAVTGEPAPTENLPVTVIERTEGDKETRLTLDLGASHLTVASLAFETSEPLFSRPVALAVRQVAENAITERTLAHDTIYRVPVAGIEPADRLEIPLDQELPGRELLVLIENGDSAPVPFTVHAARRPVYVVFLAQTAGEYQIATGNPRCLPPRYDVATLAGQLKSATVASLKVSPLAGNPSYRPTEALPEIQDLGTTLDTAEWKFRQPVRLTRGGVQQLDLDLDVLSHADASWRDLRLVRDGKQQPYIVERTSIARKLIPTASASNDPKQPHLSLWTIKLPQPNLPLTRLSCTTASALFRRQVSLYEEPTDERGEKYRRTLGQSTWVRTQSTTAPLQLFIGSAPLTDTLTLETDNGDNPAIELNNFEVFYPVTRLMFKAPLEPATWLYYGNRAAGTPQYDLDLIAPRLLAEEKTVASLGPLESLKESPVGDFFRLSGTKSIVFWVALSLVVVVLLVVIARLLPKTPAP
jgi:hypothetical protein